MPEVKKPLTPQEQAAEVLIATTGMGRCEAEGLLASCQQKEVLEIAAVAKEEARRGASMNQILGTIRDRISRENEEKKAAKKSVERKAESGGEKEPEPPPSP